MKDGKNVKERKAVALVAVVLMLMMVVQVPLSSGTDVSYAATGSSPSIGNLSITAYDQDTSDYSLLPYLNEKLPTQLNAAEWAYDDVTGLWYNISSLSTNYGKALKYGMISGISVSEIRSDIVSFFSPAPFTTSSFTVIQVEYTVNSECNVTIGIEKDGSPVFDDTSPMTMDRGGYRVVSSIQQSALFSVAASDADINLTDTKGEYTVTAKYDGISIGSKSVVYGGISHSLSGKVVDAGNDPVNGAEVKYVVYSDDSSAASIVASGSKFTAADGTYTIFAKQGEVAQITEVVRTGLTFPEQMFSYGTVQGDVSPGHTFVSKEHLVSVSVKDSSGRVATGVPVKAAWYTSKDDGGKYLITSSVDGIYCNSQIVDVRTDSNGVAYISVDTSKRPDNALLYVCSDICNYTFTTDSRVSVGNNKSNDLPAFGDLDEKGNVYVDTSTYDDVSIVADDLSIEVTVAGAKDASSNGGAALQDVEVDADWYYQMDSPSTGYCIRDNDDSLEAGSFTALVRGTAWLPNMFTDVQGKAIVCYTVPTWTSAGSEKAFLYIRAVGGASSSPSALYGFDSTVPADGSKDMVTLDSDFDAAIALAHASIPGSATVSSDDVSYIIEGTVTGSVPDSITVYCMSGTSGRYVVADSDGADIEFSFTVKAGTSNVIEINPVDGYAFSNQRQSMPTATGDQVFTSVASLSTSVVDRAIPDVVSKYRVEGLASGDVVDLRFSIGGTDCSVTIASDSDAIDVGIKGWAGNTVIGMAIEGPGLYVREPVYDPLNDVYVSQVAPVIERKYVTYYDATADQPTIDNVVGMQTIQVLCDGSLYSSMVTDQKGVATSSVPDTSTLTYRFGNLSVIATTITGGAYDGFYAINLKDVIDPIGPKQVNVTVRYIATSSLQNVELPTNVDILNGPMDMVLDVGTTKSFEAPDVEGFTFSGWYLNGESVSDSRNRYLCSFSVTDDLEGSVITASYSAETPEPPKEDIGTIVAIGMVSVTIALIALIYVILQIRRY